MNSCLWDLFLQKIIPLFLIALFIIIIWFLIRILNRLFGYSLNLVPQITVTPKNQEINLNENNKVRFQITVLRKGIFRKIRDLPVLYWISVPNKEKVWELTDGEGLVYYSKSKMTYCFQIIASARKTTAAIEFALNDKGNSEKKSYSFHIAFDKYIHPAYSRIVSVDVKKASASTKNTNSSENATIIVVHNKETKTEESNKGIIT